MTELGMGEWGEPDLQALMAAIGYLRSHNRDMTANDLASLLVRLGGPNMDAPLSARHEGIV